MLKYRESKTEYTMEHRSSLLRNIYKILPNSSAKGTYVDAVVMKSWVFFELAGGVVLVSGQELAQKMAVDVSLCCHVQRDTRRVVNTSEIAV